MVKDPLPSYWSPIIKNRPNHKLYRITCPYEHRFNLPCGTSRLMCKKCYQKQQSLKSSEVIHICDRCGFEMSGADHILYWELTNREGGVLFKGELCEACASQLGEWSKDKHFFDNFYEEGSEDLDDEE